MQIAGDHTAMNVVTIHYPEYIPFKELMTPQDWVLSSWRHLIVDLRPTPKACVYRATVCVKGSEDGKKIVVEKVFAVRNPNVTCNKAWLLRLVCRGKHSGQALFGPRSFQAQRVSIVGRNSCQGMSARNYRTGRVFSQMQIL